MQTVVKNLCIKEFPSKATACACAVLSKGIGCYNLFVFPNKQGPPGPSGPVGPPGKPGPTVSIPAETISCSFVDIEHYLSSSYLSMLFFTNCVLIAFCRDKPEHLVPRELLAPEEKKGMMENVDYRDQQGFPAPRLVINLRNNNGMFLQREGLSRLELCQKIR